MIQITTAMREALDAAEQALRNDIRFEHLAKPEDVVWRFACRCLLRRTDSHVAMEWIERAAFAGDPLIETLYHFFGLEALLGDKSEGIKGPSLAFRQMILDHLVNGYFHDPGPTPLRYDEVRSAAVHGEHVETVSAAEANNFGIAVRHTLLGYLQLANENSWTKRSELLTALDHSVDRQEFLKWVEQSNGSGNWTRFLNSMHSKSRHQRVSNVLPLQSAGVAAGRGKESLPAERRSASMNLPE